MSSEPIDLSEALKRLRLPRIRSTWKAWAERAAHEDLSHADFLRALVSDEMAAREETKLNRLLRQANFPFLKTIEDFDFRLRPQLRRKVFQTYLEDSFVREGRSLVFVGAPGLGKTHLAVSVGLRMVHRGYSVRFVTVQDLTNRFVASESAKQRQRLLRPYKRCDLLVLDEFGYLPPDPEMAPLLYEVISNRYERSATIITSNKSLKEWGRVLHDTALASALADRLLHHGDVYYLKGKSYRLRDKPSAEGSEGDE